MLCRMRLPSSGLWRLVVRIWTDVSEEIIISIFRVEISWARNQRASKWSHGLHGAVSLKKATLRALYMELMLRLEAFFFYWGLLPLRRWRRRSDKFRTYLNVMCVEINEVRIAYGVQLSVTWAVGLHSSNVTGALSTAPEAGWHIAPSISRRTVV
jgi:hypothetical protein